ncbi:MAG TPA: DinB family protein [Candidatus Eisenbacteria bacterium]|nr:DinB family protein [Candidatus Eisenbacteria bacterium]
MSISATLLPEFDQEMKTTRRLLERVPDGKGEWKPHPKSFPLAHLAQLVAMMPGWITQVLRNTRLDLSQGRGYTTETTGTLLAVFDKNVSEARAAIEQTKDADYEVPWTLAMGERDLMTMPRAAVVRQTISHLSHHRGQLTVYLRMLDVAIPSIYGPTADEKW